MGVWWKQLPKFCYCKQQTRRENLNKLIFLNYEKIMFRRKIEPLHLVTNSNSLHKCQHIPILA